MPVKPSGTKPTWAAGVTGDPKLYKEPPADRKDSGFKLAEGVEIAHLNWMLHKTCEWIQYIEDAHDEDKKDWIRAGGNWESVAASTGWSTTYNAVYQNSSTGHFRIFLPVRVGKNIKAVTVIGDSPINGTSFFKLYRKPVTASAVQISATKGNSILGAFTVSWTTADSDIPHTVEDASIYYLDVSPNSVSGVDFVRTYGVTVEYE